MKKQDVKEKKNKKIKLNKWLKYVIIFLVIFVIIPFIAIVLVTLKNVNPATTRLFFPCILYELTGLQCAGCGITRATHQVLNLNFKEAFVLNPLLFIFAITFVLLLIRYVILKILKKDVTSILKKEIKIILYVLCVITILFMILRNVVNFAIEQK